MAIAGASIPARIRDRFVQSILTEEEIRRARSAPLQLNSAGFDPWGFHPDTGLVFLALAKHLYKDYFRVKTHGIERVPHGRVLLIGNHGGQFPIDGFLLGCSMVFEAEPPRIVRGMVERWMPSLPFVSPLFARLGQVVGDPVNCRDLLAQGECVMVFPEGVRGSGKPFAKRYHLQRFGTGFVRLALETKTPIVPVAIVGHEEAYPAIAHSKLLAKLFGAPYFPITPFLPWFGFLGLVPLPTRVQVRFCEPMVFEGVDASAPEREINKLVVRVKRAMRSEIVRGLRERGDHVFT